MFLTVCRWVVLCGVGCALLACSHTPREDASRPGTGSPSYLTFEQAQGLTIHALGLVGTPYRYGGNTPESGFDCSGLIAHVYRSQTELSASHVPRTVAAMSTWGQPVRPDDKRTGDLVLFASTSRATPTHAGIYVGQGRFVHAPSTGGTVRLDFLHTPYWARQTQIFRRP